MLKQMAAFMTAGKNRQRERGIERDLQILREDSGKVREREKENQILQCKIFEYT